MAETDFVRTLLVILVGFFFIVEKKNFRAWEKMREQAMEATALMTHPASDARRRAVPCGALQRARLPAQKDLSRRKFHDQCA